MELSKVLDVCLEAVHDAGRLTLGYFGRGLEASYKEDHTPVTEADVRAEELIRGRLESAFPEHGVVGEEHGASNEAAVARWYIDPIDGTKSFMRGVPLYGVLLALEVEGRVVVGAAAFPALGETLYAAEGHGAFLNGRRVRVRDAATLQDAFVSFTDARAFELAGMDSAWRRLMASSYHRPGWGDAYGHACVATGRADVMIDPQLSAHDAGPFGVILREAGGYFGDLSGNEGIHGGAGLSCSRSLLPQVLEVLNGAPSRPDVS